jgi:hypothetical protein
VKTPIVLRALDGSNPLAFLAAVGTLRVLTMRLGHGVRMRWRRDGAWRPELVGVEGPEERLSELVHGAVSVPVERLIRGLGKEDITVEPDTFRQFVRHLERELTRDDVLEADFAAAFGSEICVQPRDDKRIQYTDLCFMTGSGHQHFLGTMEALKKSAQVSHVQDALFGEWRREQGNSMRWDPQDAAEYALRWGDPSLDGASAVWGANLLAAEALPVFGSFAVKGCRLATTGFRTGEEWQEFSWPIWTEWAGLDVVRSLVGMRQLQLKSAETKQLDDERTGKTLDRVELREMGIAEVYRSARVRIGKGANFKVSFRPAAAV